MKLYMCDLKDVDNNSMKRIVVGSGNDSSKYCVINIENDIYVIDDVCSHADFSLSQGFLDGKSKEVECPKHSAVFDVETGEAKCLPATKPVETFKAIVEDGKIFVDKYIKGPAVL